MARQTGIITMQGPLDGLSFYKHKYYGWLVRKSNPVSKERFKTDPAFERTREINSELGTTSTNAALLRKGVIGFLHDVTTDRLDNRLMSHMCKIKNKDTESTRGKRCVRVALGLNPGLLGGFEFHAENELYKFVGQNPVVNLVSQFISLLLSLRLLYLQERAISS